MLTGCIDLARTPPTYDVVASLLQLEASRLAHGEYEIFVKFLRGPNKGFRRNDLWPETSDERDRLLKSIAVPMCWLLPAVVGIETGVAPNTEFRAPVAGRGKRLHGLDRFVEALPRAGRCLQPREMVRARNPRLVTITLRECAHHPERNSNVLEWIRAAHEIAAMGHEIIFVRDTAKANEAIAGFPINVEASCDLVKRAKLYRSAFCNLFVSNGPAWFAMACDAPMLMLKPADDSLRGCFSTNYLEGCGIPRDGQVPGAGSHQRLVWRQDRAGHIVEAFREFASAAPLKMSA